MHSRSLNLSTISRNVRDVHIYSRGRWSVAVGAAVGLGALPPVPSPGDAPLYGGLVPGQLREGVGRLGVPDERLPERSGFTVSPFLQLFGL